MTELPYCPRKEWYRKNQEVGRIKLDYQKIASVKECPNHNKVKIEGDELVYFMEEFDEEKYEEAKKKYEEVLLPKYYQDKKIELESVLEIIKSGQSRYSWEWPPIKPIECEFDEELMLKSHQIYFDTGVNFTLEDLELGDYEFLRFEEEVEGYYLRSYITKKNPEAYEKALENYKINKQAWDDKLKTFKTQFEYELRIIKRKIGETND